MNTEHYNIYINKKQKGEGAFSIVHSCTDSLRNMKCAIKNLKRIYQNNEIYKSRFIREIEITNSIQIHPNIIDIYDYCVSGQENFYVMPLATCNLKDFITTNNTKLLPETRVFIFNEILEAIKFAHEKEIIHRDLCPSNILVLVDGESLKITVSDFGLGKDLSAYNELTSSSKNHYGHIDYIAPEQKARLKDATIMSDIYSMGRLLHFIYTGKDPFNPDDNIFTNIIRKSTEYNPLKRFNNILDFETAYLNAREVLFLPQLTKTLVDLNNNIDTEPIAWNIFYTLAMKEEFYTHVYHDYVSPICNILLSDDNIIKCFNSLNQGMYELLLVFNSKIEECFSITGWPFKETDKFGFLYKHMFDKINDEKIKTLSFKMLWSIAYEKNRYSSQKLIQLLFRQSIIPKNIELTIASVINQSNADIKPDDDLLRIDMPDIIRRAINDKL